MKDLYFSNQFLFTNVQCLLKIKKNGFMLKKHAMSIHGTDFSKAILNLDTI